MTTRCNGWIATLQKTEKQLYNPLAGITCRVSAEEQHSKRIIKMIKFTKKNLIQHLRLDAETASELVSVHDGDFELNDYEQTAEWVSRCYNSPSDCEISMSIMAEILHPSGYCGVEAHFEEFRIEPMFSYLNAGDSYGFTIVEKDGDFGISSYGDMI